MEKDEARRRMVCRRVFWSYNRVWLESRLFVMALFLAVGVYCCVRDGGGGGFWPGSIALTACAAFFFLPPSVPRFVFRGWMDVRKNRVSAAEIIIQACDESTGYAMLSRSVNTEAIRKLLILDENGGRFYGFVPLRAMFDGSALIGRRFRVAYLTESRLIVAIAPLDPPPRSVKARALLHQAEPLIQQDQAIQKASANG